MLRIVPYAAIHFTAYERFRDALVHAMPDIDSEVSGEADLQNPDPHHHHHHHHHVSPLLDLVAGSAAGATAVLLTYPLDLVRTRLAYGAETAPSSSAATASAPERHPGGAVSGGALRSGPPGNVAAAGAAGAASAARPTARRLTIRQVLRTTLAEEGLAGLYRGIGPTLVGILPYAGLKFYVYQSLKQQFREATSRDADHRLPVPVMLTFGAASGLVAQTATYPLDLVRRRMQVPIPLLSALAPAAHRSAEAVCSNGCRQACSPMSPGTPVHEQRHLHGRTRLCRRAHVC